MARTGPPQRATVRPPARGVGSMTGAGRGRYDPCRVRETNDQKSRDINRQTLDVLRTQTAGTSTPPQKLLSQHVYH